MSDTAHPNAELLRRFYAAFAALDAATMAACYASDAQFQDEVSQMINEATNLEIRYAHDTMPRGVLGLNAGQFNEYLKFIANRRCQQIGIKQLYSGATNPFPWMSEVMDLKKEKNFFETRVTEYQTGGALSWD